MLHMVLFGLHCEDLKLCWMCYRQMYVDRLVNSVLLVFDIAACFMEQRLQQFFEMF